MHELEIKLLGSRDQLEHALSNYMKKCFNSKPAHNYSFSTFYYDQNKHFEDQGFSLRYRSKANGYKPNLELKQLSGAKDGISSRLEIKSVGDFMGAYFNMIGAVGYPASAPVPHPHSLEAQFEIQAYRREQNSFIKVGNLCCKIESAFDHIHYLKDGQIVASEDELEFEIKSGAVDLPAISQWFQENVIDGTGCVKTMESKALRAREFINQAPAVS